jgi:site-specific DNA-methyltransferase (adenine-specific)
MNASASSSLSGRGFSAIAALVKRRSRTRAASRGSAASRPTLIYAQDGIEVHVGDCREVIPRRLAELGLRAADVALVHVDPPYGTGERLDRRARAREAGGTGRGRLVGGRGRPRGRNWPPMVGDDGPFDPAPFLHYPRVVLWGANHYASRLDDTRSWLFWDKRAETGSDDGADGELAWTNLGGPMRRFTHLWRGVCRASETGVAHLGPTQKPVALIEWIFRTRAKLRAGDLVIVPYCGSGPELAVCRRLRLRCIAVDIDPRWCEIAVRERLLGGAP